VKIQCLIKKLDSLISIPTFPPLNKSLEVNQISILLRLSLIISLINFIDEFKLLLSIIQLFLLHSAIDHANEWSHVCLIKRSCLLVGSVRAGVVALDLLFVTDLSMEKGVFWLKPNS